VCTRFGSYFLVKRDGNCCAGRCALFARDCIIVGVGRLGYISTANGALDGGAKASQQNLQDLDGGGIIKCGISSIFLLFWIISFKETFDEFGFFTGD